MIIHSRLYSTDGMAVKYLQRTHDGNLIETAYVNYPNKYIMCFSTLIGCPIGCRFCISGVKGRYIRPLLTAEILAQCYNILAEVDTGVRPLPKPLLFSVMGEGEPFLNYEALIEALYTFRLFEPDSKIAISTSGINPKKIEHLASLNMRIKLQFSLHGVTDDKRKKIIPNTKPLKEIRDALLKYSESGQSVDINYILMSGVNDQIDDVFGVIDFVKDTNWGVKINRFNTFDGIEFQPSTRLNWFIEHLKYHGIDAEYYETNGSDIGGACGQMSYTEEKKEIQAASAQESDIPCH